MDRALVVELHVKPETPGERGMPKRAVRSLAVTRSGAAGDYNRWRSEKAGGDPDQAILLIRAEHLAELAAEGWPVGPGVLGENLTIRGVPAEALVPGARVRVGAVVLEISKPCPPCGLVGGLPGIGPERVDAFRAALRGRRGWFARVLDEGVVTAGEALTVEPAAARREGVVVEGRPDVNRFDRPR